MYVFVEHSSFRVVSLKNAKDTCKNSESDRNELI